MEGSSSLAICFMTRDSKLASGTKTAVLGPVEFFMAVSTSKRLRPSKGCTFSSVPTFINSRRKIKKVLRPKVSWKI